MANKVVLEVVDFEKVTDLFNHTSFPSFELRKAFEVAQILNKAQLMDLTPLPSTEPVKLEQA